MYKKINPLQNKKILLCVTGSIAAFKTCEIVRLLRKQGTEVQVMMSQSAEKFIGKATFAALTNNEVLTNLFPDTPKPGLEHIKLSLNLDLIVVVPATFMRAPPRSRARVVIPSGGYRSSCRGDLYRL